MKAVQSLSARRASRALGAALAVALLLGLTATAAHAGAITSQTVLVVSNPAGQSATIRGPGSLLLDFDSTYAGSSPYTPGLAESVVSLDDNFLIEPQGFPQCNPSSIAGTTTAQALAACPTSKIGAGSATLIGPAQDLNFAGTVFNGTPSNGQPTIVTHLWSSSPDLKIVLVAVVESSPLPGFGQQLHLFFPPVGPGYVFKHLDFTVDQLETSPGHGYFSARCSVVDHAWNYQGAFTYTDSSTRSDSGVEICDAVPTLNVKRRGDGKGKVKGPGILCPPDCAQAFPFNTALTLAAFPARRSRFTGWGNSCTGKAKCALTMSQNRSVTATFRRCRRARSGAATAKKRCHRRCHKKRCHRR